MSAPVARALFQVLVSPNTPALSCALNYFTAGQYSPTWSPNSRPRYHMEANQHLEQEHLTITPPCAAAPKPNMGRACTTQVLGKDWNPSLFERYCPQLSSPGNFTLEAFGGGGIHFRHAEVIPHKPGRNFPCGSIQSSSRFGGISAPLPCDLLRFGLSFSTCLPSFLSSGEF